jgi:hypothetical protein
MEYFIEKKNTYSEIDSKPWLEDFKLNSKQAYNRFEKEGVGRCLRK